MGVMGGIRHIIPMTPILPIRDSVTFDVIIFL